MKHYVVCLWELLESGRTAERLVPGAVEAEGLPAVLRVLAESLPPYAPVVGLRVEEVPGFVPKPSSEE